VSSGDEKSPLRSNGVGEHLAGRREAAEDVRERVVGHRQRRRLRLHDARVAVSWVDDGGMPMGWFVSPLIRPTANGNIVGQQKQKETGNWPNRNRTGIQLGAAPRPTQQLFIITPQILSPKKFDE
jgi:hypothetical protein